jgi:hypothetical protein
VWFGCSDRSVCQCFGGSFSEDPLMVISHIILCIVRYYSIGGQYVPTVVPRTGTVVAKSLVREESTWDLVRRYQYYRSTSSCPL